MTTNQTKKGGTIAGNARRELEQKSGKKVSIKGNYLKQPQSQKSLKG